MTTLSAQSMSVSYGKMEVVHDVTLSIETGKIVGLLGLNGAGKTSTLRALCGLERPSNGKVVLDGVTTSRMAAWKVARAGVSAVLESARVFGELSVAENISIAKRRVGDTVRATSLFTAAQETFPAIGTKLHMQANSLSGGERQQLAIIQALCSAPTVLLLDEPSVGLAPAVVKSVYSFLDQIRTHLAICVAEQMTGALLGVADLVIVLDSGAVAISGPASELGDSQAVESLYMGVAAPPGRR